jgi:hypothetical protein
MGVSDPEAALMRLYPNPASSTVSIHSQTGVPELGTIVIRDITGTIQQSYDAAGSVHITLDVSALSEGLYTVVIQGKSGPVYKRLIIQ